MPRNSTGLGFSRVDGECSYQQIGIHKVGLRATYRTNVAPGRDRVHVNGLFFVIRKGRLYSFLTSAIKSGSAVFTLRDSDGQTVLVNLEVS